MGLRESYGSNFPDEAFIVLVRLIISAEFPSTDAFFFHSVGGDTFLLLIQAKITTL